MEEYLHCIDIIQPLDFEFYKHYFATHNGCEYLLHRHGVVMQIEIENYFEVTFKLFRAEDVESYLRNTLNSNYLWQYPFDFFTQYNFWSVYKVNAVKLRQRDEEHCREEGLKLQSDYVDPY